MENKKGSFLQTGCLVFLGSLVITICLILSIIVYLVSSLFDSFEDMTYTYNNSIEEEFYHDYDEGEKTIAIIELHNIISMNDETSFVKKALNKVMQDDSIIGVILSLDTPGGEVTKTDEIYHLIQLLRAKGKTIVSCMRSVATSGGYYIAAGTDYIIANKYTITGSIGVIFNAINFYKLAKRNGVESITIKSGVAKDSFHPLQPISEESKKIFENLINESYKGFAQVVSKGRNINYKLFFDKKSPYGTAQIMLGNQALKLKLIDQLGYFDDAIEKIKELTSSKKLKIKYLRPSKKFIDVISELGIEENKLLEKISVKMEFLKSGRLYYQAAEIN